MSGLIGFETRGAQHLGARGSMSPVSKRQLACRSACASLSWVLFLERILLAQSDIVEDVTDTVRDLPYALDFCSRKVVALVVVVVWVANAASFCSLEAPTSRAAQVGSQNTRLK